MYVCVYVYVRFGFAFPFGHQGDRTTAPAPLPPDEASIAEEINGWNTLPSTSLFLLFSLHSTAALQRPRNDSVVVASVAMNFLLIRDERWGGRGGGSKEPSHFKFLARSNAHVTVKDSWRVWGRGTMYTGIIYFFFIASTIFEITDA